jgi:hypothetical protein
MSILTNFSSCIYLRHGVRGQREEEGRKNGKYK